MDGITSLRIDLPTALVEDAEKAGIDVANLMEEVLRRELQRRRPAVPTEAEVQAWESKNRTVIDNYNRWIEENGGSVGDEYRPF